VNELVSACPDSVAAWSIQRQALLTARDYAGLVELDRERATRLDDPGLVSAVLLEAAWVARHHLQDLQQANSLLEVASDDWSPLVDLQEEVLRELGEWQRLVN